MVVLADQNSAGTGWDKAETFPFFWKPLLLLLTVLKDEEEQVKRLISSAIFINKDRRFRWYDSQNADGTKDRTELAGNCNMEWIPTGVWRLTSVPIEFIQYKRVFDEQITLFDRNRLDFVIIAAVDKFAKYGYPVQALHRTVRLHNWYAFHAMKAVEY